MSRQFDFEIHTPNLNSLTSPSQCPAKVQNKSPGRDRGFEDYK
jgi:hypothetical protein